MVIDAAVLVDARHAMAHARQSPPRHTSSEESERDRTERVRRLAALVRDGSYDVRAERLAAALLDWDPRRSSPKGSAETADRRRTYMREYMRRRRAGELAGLVPPLAETQAALSL